MGFKHTSAALIALGVYFAVALPTAWVLWVPAEDPMHVMHFLAAMLLNVVWGRVCLSLAQVLMKRGKA